MRRHWQSIVLALCCSLALAASASAECAWVLWTQTLDQKARFVQGEWHLAQGYSVREECIQAMERLERRAVANSVSTMCLPETVDPRGPKGT